MKSDIINFSFKGERTYVHGPDIFNELINFTEKSLNIDFLNNINLNLYKLVKSNVIVKHFEGKVYERTPDSIVVMKFDTNSMTHWLTLSEIDSKINRVISYDEDVVVSLCKINIINKVIKFEGISPFTLLETIVAMNKALHLSLYQDLIGKWIFVKCDFYWWSTINYSNIELKIYSIFSNKITKTEIFIDGKSFGFIFFVLS